MTAAARQMTLKAAETISHIQQPNKNRRVRTGTLISCWGGRSGSAASGRTWRYVGVAIKARRRSAAYSEITKSSNHIHSAVKYGKFMYEVDLKQGRRRSATGSETLN